MSRVSGQGTRDPGAPESGVAATPDAGVRPGALSALLRELVRGDAPTAAPPREPPGPGTVIGRFELVRELGRGGFGIVYEARDSALGRSVALKLVRPPDGAAARDGRLLAEAEAAARLSHANIVTLHDVGQCEHGPYLVLELLRGRTLEERLAQGPMALAEAVRIGLEVAQGLAHAHAHGVVHRDLTPRNVFLCDDGHVKLLDLGMAHAFGRRKVDGGTPAYMAPEQREGAPEDERTDVFALGLVLVRMTTGALPGTDGGTIAPELVIPSAPALAALVDRMLQRDPVERPRDAAAVRDVLTAVHQELARVPADAAAVRVRRPRRRARTVAVVMLATLGAVALIAWSVLQRHHAAPAGAPSIAVLPFADMSPEKDQGYFSDGLAEEILNALAQVPGLHVAGRTSSFAFRGTNADPATIGDKLHVTTVLEGSVRKAGSRVRITAQIVSLADGYHLWSQTFDRELTDVFAIEDEIARAVVSALQVNVMRANAAGRTRATSTAAYTQYLLGKQWYARYTLDGFRRAADAFEKAIAADPSYAPAWAGLAVQLFSIANAGEAGRAEAASLRERAMDAAERAVSLDPELPEAYATRGTIRAFHRWDWSGALADVERALALSPGDATVVRRHALVQEVVGRHDAAVHGARRATELDPLFPSNWLALEQMLLREGDVRGARAAYERVREIAPDYVGLDGTAAYLLLAEGDLPAALTAYQRCSREPERLAGIAGVQHALGHEAEAASALDALVSTYGDSEAHVIAAVYAVRGDRDRAFEWLERAWRQDPQSMLWLVESPTASVLRSDPRYGAFLRRMNLPVQ